MEKNLFVLSVFYPNIALYKDLVHLISHNRLYREVLDLQLNCTKRIFHFYAFYFYLQLALIWFIIRTLLRSHIRHEFK